MEMTIMRALFIKFLSSYLAIPYVFLIISSCLSRLHKGMPLETANDSVMIRTIMHFHVIRDGKGAITGLHLPLNAPFNDVRLKLSLSIALS